MYVEKFISYQIEKQFPSIYREDGRELIDLIKYYYEFLENDIAAFYIQGNKLVNGVSESFSETGSKVAKNVIQPFADRTEAEQRLFYLRTLPSYSNLVLRYRNAGFYIEGEILVNDVVESFTETGTTVVAILEPFADRTEAEQRLFYLKTLPSYSNLVLKEDKNQSVYNNRRLFEYRDIDNTLESMVIFFKNKYMKDLPLDGENTRFVVKNILDLYRRRGTSEGVELFFRLFYNESIDIYYPAEAILKPSSSTWNSGIFLQLYPTEIGSLKDLTGRSIYGSVSKAEAVVDRILFTLVNNVLTPILYLGSVRGTFVGFDDIYSFINGNTINFGRVYGSLASIEINQKDKAATNGNNIGDIVNVTYTGARGGKAIVTDVSQNITGEISYEIDEPGFGYTKDNTLLLVSNQIIFSYNLFENLNILETLRDQYGNSGTVIGGNENIVGVRMEEGFEFSANSIIVTTRSANTYFNIVGNEVIIADDNLIVIDENVANTYFTTNDNLIYPFISIVAKNDSSPGPLYPEVANTAIDSVKLVELSNAETISLITDRIDNFLAVQLDSANYNDLPPALVVMSGTADPVTINTPLNQAFNLEPFEIGSIKRFSNTNPGSNYVNRAFAIAYDPIMTNFDVYNQVIVLESISATFEIGSILTQGSTTGKITRIVNNTIFIIPYTYAGFNTSAPITFKGNSYNVLSVSRDYDSDKLGFNAKINAITQFAVGKILSVVITNSGYGYVDKDPVTLTNNAGGVLAVGIANARGQGKIEGRWSSKESHLNFQDGKVLQDSDYYQEYSYRITSKTDINTYKTTLTDIAHLAGTKMFGEFVLKDEVQVKSNAKFSIIRNS